MVKSTSRRPQSKQKPARKAPSRKAAARRQARCEPRPRQSKASARAKWVYAFGDGKAEGNAQMRNLLGGKGAGLAEMANLGLPVPPGFTITTEVCTHYYANGKAYPKDLERQVEAGARAGRAHHRQALRRPRQSAAGLGALRRARLDARHDGHGAQSRPQRRDRRGAGEEVRRPALRLRHLSPLHHDVFRRGARHRPSSLRGAPRRPQGPQRLHARHRSRRPTTGSSSSAATRSGSRRSTASRSRRTRTSSCGAPSARCSARG